MEHKNHEAYIFLELYGTDNVGVHGPIKVHLSDYYDPQCKGTFMEDDQIPLTSANNTTPETSQSSTSESQPSFEYPDIPQTPKGSSED